VPDVRRGHRTGAPDPLCISFFHPSTSVIAYLLSSRVTVFVVENIRHPLRPEHSVQGAEDSLYYLPETSEAAQT